MTSYPSQSPRGRRQGAPHPLLLTHLFTLSLPLTTSACSWSQPARQAQPEPPLVFSRPVQLSELSRSSPTVCEPSRDGRPLTFYYLADQLGDSLRERAYCLSSELTKEREAAALSAGRCREAQGCGSAHIHPWLPDEVGAYLALIDLVVKRSSLQVRSMKTGYEDQHALSRSSELIENPNQDVSHALAHQTQVGRQDFHFTLGTRGQCLYRLKTFKELSRDELVYGGLRGLTKRFDSQGFTSARYLVEVHQTAEQSVALLLVDISSEGVEEEDLLQHQLLCKLPREVSALTQLTELSVWMGAQGDQGRLIELSAPIGATRGPQTAPMRELNEELKGRARERSAPWTEQGKGASSR